MAFVGLREEYDEWQFHFPGSAIYQPVQDALELAGIISGARIFIGNQSLPMSLALALNVPIVQEVSPNNSDCVFNRANAVYYRTGSLALPSV